MVEGTPLLREHTGQNLYRGFESLSLRQSCLSRRFNHIPITEVAVTGFVGPGAITAFVSLGFISPGKHVVGVQAEGQAGGCNVGNLVSWAGKVRLRPAP